MLGCGAGGERTGSKFKEEIFFISWPKAIAGNCQLTCSQNNNIFGK
jgi:hypothetical protein